MNVAEIIIRVVELFEAEGRSLRKHAVRAAIVLVGVGVLGMVALGGVGMLFASLYLRVRAETGDITAALVTGLSCLLVAVIGVYGSWKWLNQ